MNDTLLSKLQELNDIQSVYVGILQYLDQHSQRFGSILEAAGDYISTGIATKIDAHLLEGFVLKGGLTEDDGKLYVHVLDLKSSIMNFMNSDELDASDINLACVDENGDSATVSLAEAMDMMSDAYAQEQSLSLTILSMLDVVRGVYENLYDSLKAKLEGAEVKTNIKNKLLSSVLSIGTTYGGITEANIKPLSGVIFQLFGFKKGEAAMVETEIGEYSGVNALTTILTSFGNSVSEYVQHLPSKLANAVRMLAGGIQYVYLAGAAKIGSWLSKQWNTITGARDSFQFSKKGDGAFILDCSYYYPNYLGSWQLQYLDNAFATLNTTQLAGYFPTGTMLIQKTDSGYQMNYIPRIINYGVILNVFNHFFGISADTFLPWKQDGANKITLTNATLSSFTATEDKIMNALTEIFSSNDCLLDGSLCSDSSLAMSVLATRALHHIIVSLYVAGVNDTSVDGTWLYNRIVEAYNATTKDIIVNKFSVNPSVTNVLMGVIIGSLQPDTTAFGSWFGASHYYNIETLVDTTNWTYINWFAEIARLVWAPTSISDGTGIFTPYSTQVILPKASWCLPTDADNIDAMQAYLTTGGIIIGAVVAAIVAVVVFKNLKAMQFSLAARAGDLSWKAAASGNATDMATAFKLNKRARLLDRLLGHTLSTAGSAVSVSYDSDLIKAVGKKIDPNF